jgi:hypothetical protein
MRQKQRGITFLGLVVVAGILVFGGIVGMQVFPTFVEFLAIQKAAKKAATGGSVPEVRSLFDKAAQIDDIRTIAGKDLEVSKQGDKVVVSFTYQREIHLGGPAYLLMKYQGSSR